MLVQIAAGEDPRVLEALGVEDLAGLPAEAGQVAGVQADAKHVVPPFA